MDYQCSRICGFVKRPGKLNLEPTRDTMPSDYLRRGMNSQNLESDPTAVHVTIANDKIAVDLADGRILLVPLEWYPRLQHATDLERHNWQLLGNGYAIDWPDIDEHIG